MQAQLGSETDGARDFDFLTGRWRIHNRRLMERLKGCTEWEEFEAVSQARPLLSGMGNEDDFRTDWRPGFVGMTVRLYDPATRLWSIYWASNQRGVFEPPVIGAFSRDVGTFEGAMCWTASRSACASRGRARARRGRAGSRRSPMMAARPGSPTG